MVQLKNFRKERKKNGLVLNVNRRRYTLSSCIIKRLYPLKVNDGRINGLLALMELGKKYNY